MPDPVLFTLGAGFNPGLLPEIAVAALVLCGAMLVLKRLAFRVLLSQSEKNLFAWDIGCCLGQPSEVSLLIACVAVNGALIGELASHLIQAAAILSFLVPSYIVLLHPYPIKIREELRRDRLYCL